MPDLREKLERFLYNLDLQIDDLERLKSGKRIELFFDTAHVVSAVLGLHDFYTEADMFRKTRFSSHTALVNSLAASNWLGEIRLLPPHQAEFLRRWHFDFGVHRTTRKPEIVAQRFLRDVGYNDSQWVAKKSVRFLSNEEIRRLIVTQAASAPTFFKAVQSLVPWQRRMAQMLEDETLTFHTAKENYDRIFKSAWPDRLAEQFNLERPDVPINNVADALALSILIEKVRQLNEEESNVVPFLFPSDLILKVIDNEEVVEALTYGKTPAGRNILAVKDWPYFVFKVTFIGFHRNGGTSGDIQKQLKSLRDEIGTMLALNREITIDQIAQQKAFGKPLTRLLEEIDELSFFENVWLKARAPEDLRSALRAVNESIEDFRRSKRVQSQAAQILERKRHELSANVQEIDWIIRLWANLEKHAKRLHAEAFSTDFQSRNLFRDRGLLRYSFPQRPRAEIERVLEALIEGIVSKEARSKVFNACLIGVNDPMRGRDDLVMASAVLLALGMNEQLLELLDRVDPHLPHFSLKIAYVELVFLLRENRDRGESILQELKANYEETQGKGRKADLAVGLGYLMFRLWHLKGGKVKWRRFDETESSSEPAPAAHKFVEAAIFYVEEAYEALARSRDIKKKTYALNQYLYYLVEGGGDKQIPDMVEAAQKLTGFATNPEVWQYRFDDTLARFFHRMATKKTDPKDWATAMDSARHHINSACERAFGDKIPVRYRSKIDTAIQAGFEARLKPKRPPRVIKIEKSTKP